MAEEAIHKTLHFSNINQANRIEIPSVWMPLMKQSKERVWKCNSKDLSAPITDNLSVKKQVVHEDDDQK